MPAKAGFVYLLHFDRRLEHAGHYVGWAKDLDARIKQHRSGSGARLTAVVHRLGIGFQVARVWEGDRHLERRIKRRKCSPRLCPLCSPGGVSHVSE